MSEVDDLDGPNARRVRMETAHMKALPLDTKMTLWRYYRSKTEMVKLEGDGPSRKARQRDEIKGLGLYWNWRRRTSRIADN